MDLQGLIASDSLVLCDPAPNFADCGSMIQVKLEATVMGFGEHEDNCRTYP
jgi:hypothetical protein